MYHLLSTKSRGKTLARSATSIAVFVVFILSMGSITALCAAGLGSGDHAKPDIVAFQTNLGPSAVIGYTGPGEDFVVVGTTTRVFNPSSISQTNPFTMVIPKLPGGAVVDDIIILWNYLANDNPLGDGIIVNGSGFGGNRQGYGIPDICWSKSYGVAYANDLAQSIIHPSTATTTNVTIQNATDKVLGTDANAYGDGITIFVVFHRNGKPMRVVDVYTGYTSTTTGVTTNLAEATLNYSITYTGGKYHFFLNALDGQQGSGFGDDFWALLNFVPVQHSNDIHGVSALGDAWQGKLGPASANNLYDQIDDDLSPFIFSFNNYIYFYTDGTLGDCIAHTFAAVSLAMTGCDAVPGDANDDGTINISDVVYLISYIFAGGAAPSPYPVASGDANCDGIDNISDAVYLISYIFAGGSAPCNCSAWTTAHGTLH